MPLAAACSIPPEQIAGTQGKRLMRPLRPSLLPSMFRLIFSVCRIPGI